MAELRTFTRATQGLSSDVKASVRPLLGGQVFGVHLLPTSIEIRAESWDGVDLVAVQAALDAVPDAATSLANTEKDQFDNWKLLKAVGLVVADLHGLTPAQMRQLVRDKYDSL